MTIDELYALYCLKGIKAAARAARMRDTTLKVIFKQHGLAVRERSISEQQATEWHQHYRAGASLPDVSAKFGASVRRLKRAFRLYGLPLKTAEQVKTEKAIKTKRTNLAVHNVEYASQAEISKQHYVETCRERYNVDNVAKLPSVIKKRVATYRERYRDAKALNARRAATNRERAQTFAAKTCATNLARRGFEHVGQDPAVIEKIRAAKHAHNGERLRIELDEIGYTLLEPYRGDRVLQDGRFMGWRRYRIRHVCGHEFLDDIAMPPRCPVCYPLNRSVAEVQLSRWIEQQGFRILTGVRDLIKNPVTGRGFEIDIVLPTQRIAIEYNGLFYHNGRRDHALKTDLCAAEGFKLYHVWEHVPREIVRYRLATVLGLAPNIAQNLLLRTVPYLQHETALVDRDWCPDWRDAFYLAAGFTFVRDDGPSARYVHLRTRRVVPTPGPDVVTIHTSGTFRFVFHR